MKLEEVTKAAEQGAVVLHTHMGITSRCRISGVVSRFAKGAWTYSLELLDLKGSCVITAGLDEVEVTLGENGLAARN